MTKCPQNRKAVVGPLLPVLDRLLTSVCVLATILVATLIGIRLLPGSRTVDTLLNGLDVAPNWRSLYETGALLGSSSASVELLVFSDYTCPACGDLSESIDTLLSLFPSDLSVRYRHFPLNDGVARSAAIAAECGSKQGKFLPLHRQLFSNADSLGLLGWGTIADRAGVPDLKRFRTCTNSTMTKRVVAEDIRAGIEIGVDATPTILVGGRILVGNPPLSVLKRIISRQLADGGESDAN